MSEWTSAPRVGIVHDNTERSMDPWVKELWIEALTGGEYPQGHYYLRQEIEGDHFYDPLGVLTGVAVEHKITTWEHVKNDNLWFSPGGEPTRISTIVYEWANFKGMHPSQVCPLEWANSLHPIWRLSDHYKLTFDVIADLLGRQY